MMNVEQNGSPVAVDAEPQVANNALSDALSRLSKLEVTKSEVVEPKDSTQDDTSDLGFKVIERDSDTYVNVYSERLRYVIWDYIESQNLITRRDLYVEQDTDLIKKDKDKSAVYEIGSLIREWGEELTDPDYVKDMCARYKATANKLAALAEYITESRNKMIAEAKVALMANKISFKMLWLALQMDDLYVSHQMSDTTIAGKVIGVSFESGNFFSPPRLEVSLEVFVHDGTSLVQSQTEVTIPQYEGEIEVEYTGLSIISDELRAQLVSRGKRYVDLTRKPSYIHLDGNIARRSWWGPTMFRSTGRAMVDFRSLRSIDPNYNYFFGIDRHSRNGRAIDPSVLTDNMYMCMSPYVYGFSFASKIWGEMLVDNIVDIQFRDDAYDKLVLDTDTKDMLFALVDAPAGSSIGKDFIAGKGGGCIFLLAGSPGVGKTLTAESIAEKLRQPLYMVGVGELGTTVETLERNLRNILDMATSWGAVLLLDECDIFMEARDDSNLERNAMVGVFLRLLEYYQGTLFLTTNRANNLDEAFYSRISLAIQYKALTSDARKQIWANVLELNEVTTANPAVLAGYEINGRQIKNVTRLVTALAAKRGIAPTDDDFIKVITHVTTFDGHIKD